MHEVEVPLHKRTEPLPTEPITLSGKAAEAMDDRTLVIRFRTPEERQTWKALAAHLGHDEHALARHMLTNFIGYCQGPEDGTEDGT